MKKSLIVCLIAILALGVMGFGFAKWSDTVTIDASVATGNVEIGILDAGVTDLGADPQYAPGHNEEGKNVASIVSVNDPATAIRNTGYFKSVTETITNAYPWYKPGTTIEIKNLGSIPVKIDTITGGTWTGPLADNINIASFTVTGPSVSVVSGSNPTWADLVAAIGHTQLHTNDTLTVKIEWYIAENAPDGSLCEMLSSASTSITVQASQWNEVDTTYFPSNPI